VVGHPPSRGQGPIIGVEARSKWEPGRSTEGFSGDSGLARDHGAQAIERLVALMHSKNESVAVRAAEALLDRGYGRPVQGMELSGAERPVPRVIHVEFVTPPKRDEHGSIPQRPSIIGLPALK